MSGRGSFTISPLCFVPAGRSYATQLAIRASGGDRVPKKKKKPQAHGVSEALGDGWIPLPPPTLDQLLDHYRPALQEVHDLLVDPSEVEKQLLEPAATPASGAGPIR